MQDLRPEIEILLHISRKKIEPERRERLRCLFQQKLDWQYLNRAAIRHALKPLLFRNLNEAGLESVLGRYAGSLKEYFFSNAARNLHMTSALVKVLKVLEHRGIAALPYKGPVLTATIYENAPLREYADLDIVVQKSDVMKTRNVLAQEGYRLVQNESRHAFYLKHKHHFVFQNDQEGIMLELHWAFTKQPLRVSFDQTWLLNRACPVTVAGENVQNLCAEDLLVILCVHGTKHRWERLIWLCDIAELIRTTHSLDWEQVVQLSKQRGCLRILLTALQLARELLDLELPEIIIRRIESDVRAKSLAKVLSIRMLTDVADVNRDDPLFFLHIRERLPDKVRVLAYYLYIAAVSKDGDSRLVNSHGFLRTFRHLTAPLRRFKKLPV